MLPFRTSEKRYTFFNFLLYFLPCTSPPFNSSDLFGVEFLKSPFITTGYDRLGDGCYTSKSGKDEKQPRDRVICGVLISGDLFDPEVVVHLRVSRVFIAFCGIVICNDLTTTDNKAVVLNISF